MRHYKIRGISRARKLYYDRRIKEAKKEFFKEDAVFLDIEATGICEKDDFFMIGLYDGICTKTLLKDNFDCKKLKDNI